ncbi:MAG: hypothetical protein FWG65_07650 [Turicibacter sp.]|nr:hypothetical protein [Turicibacter sp.]
MTKYCTVEGTLGISQQIFYETKGSMVGLATAKNRIKPYTDTYTLGNAEGSSTPPRAFTYLPPSADADSKIGSLIINAKQKHKSEGGVSERYNSRYYQAIHYYLDDGQPADFIKSVLDLDALKEDEAHHAESINEDTPLIDRYLTAGDISREILEKNRAAMCNAIFYLMNGEKIIFAAEKTDEMTFEDRAREILVQLYSLIPPALCWGLGFSTYRRNDDFNTFKKDIAVFVVEADAISPVLDGQFQVIKMDNVSSLEDDEMARIFAWSKIPYEERLKYGIDANFTLSDVIREFMPDWKTEKIEGTIHDLETLIDYHQSFPKLSENPESDLNREFSLRIPKMISSQNRFSLLDPLVDEINEISKDGAIVFTEKGKNLFSYCCRELRCLGSNEVEIKQILKMLKKNTEAEESSRLLVEEIAKLEAIAQQNKTDHNMEVVSQRTADIQNLIHEMLESQKQQLTKLEESQHANDKNFEKLYVLSLSAFQAMHDRFDKFQPVAKEMYESVAIIRQTINGLMQATVEQEQKRTRTWKIATFAASSVLGILILAILALFVNGFIVF